MGVASETHCDLKNQRGQLAQVFKTGFFGKGNIGHGGSLGRKNGLICYHVVSELLYEDRGQKIFWTLLVYHRR